jgi:hypothetical protein
MGLLAAALLELSSGIASAQNADPRTTARLRLGPVYVAPTFEVRDIGLDTNVYNESLAEPIKDFVLTAIPTFVATVGPPRRALTVRSATSLVYFAKQTSERSVNQDLTLTARGTFGRFVPFAELGYLNTRDRVSFEVDARARRIEERVAGGLQVNATPKVSFDVRGDVWQNTYDGDAVFQAIGLAAELNRKSQTFGGGVRYRLTPLTTVGVLAELSNIRFTEGSFRDTDTQQMLFSIELNPRALISGQARLGVQNFRPLNPQLPDFNGLIGSAAVSYRLPSSTTITFTFDRRADFSYYVAEPYYIHEGYGLAARRRLTQQWDIELGASRESHDYIDVLGTQGQPQEGQWESLVTGNATLGYDVGPRTRMILGLLYSDRRSDISSRRYSGMRVGASMIYSF